VNGEESRRIEKAMLRQGAMIGQEIKALGDKIDTVGNRVTVVETKLADHLEYGTGVETTGVGPNPLNTVTVPWRWLILLIGLAAGGGGAKLLGMF